MARLVTFLCLLALSAAVQGRRRAQKCPDDCQRDCSALRSCLSGTKYDVCGCCQCARALGEYCDPRGTAAEQEEHGQCGEYLECRPLEKGRKRVCFCVYESQVCGSDSKTYPNLCHLTAAAARNSNRTDLVVRNKGPCEEENVKPRIVTGPEHTKNRTGGSIVLSCEAKGYPVPHISWLKTNVKEETFDLPGDDMSMMTASRGGPDPHEMTSWIQISKALKIHEGDYTCVAHNVHGVDKSKARVKIMEVKDGLGTF